MKRINVFVNGVKLDYFRTKDELRSINKPSIYISIAGETIYRRDKEFLSIVNSHNAVCFADGELGVLALKKAGYKDAIKIAGCEFWIDLLEKRGVENTVIVGSSEIVANKVHRKIIEDYGVEPTFCRNGYLKETDVVNLEKVLLEKRPKLVVIAQGQPNQEKLAVRLSKVYECDYICIGGALDVYSGCIKRAPGILINLKLEWFYRLITQPSRITRQLVLFSVLARIIFDNDYVEKCDVDC